MDLEMSSTEDILLDLEKGERGSVKQSIGNCMTVFYRDPILKGGICRNELTCKTDIVKDMGWKRSPTASITDVDIFQIQRYLERIYGLRSERNINKAISIIASENSYHPIKKFLEKLEWDGEERISHAMTKYLGVDENEYSEALMKLLLTAAIKRIYEPGCKYDIMVCLVGGQGAGKSTFFRFLAVNDEWFTDDLKKIDDEQVYRKMQGHWFIEMSEMLGTVNAKSVEEIKSFISRPKETYKIPYETHPEDRPRQCVFVGTSNDLQFLPFDMTGNRRFAPVMVHPERVKKHILEDEQEARAYFIQVWAEAMVIYRQSVHHELKLPKVMEEQLRELQRDFMPEDTNIGIIQAWLDGCGKDYVCSRMIYELALGHEDSEPKQWEIKKINEIMNISIIGWEPVSSHRFTGTNYGIQRGWKRKEDIDFVPVPEGEAIPFDDK
jgi:predicted P-loop ATPase